MKIVNDMVSIIIPTYNREQVIGRSIASVLNQTYPYFELLIVDDGSVDQTKQVVERITDERIHYIALDKNQGVGHARNIGMQEAKYDYLAFLDSDDEWMPEKLELQMEKMLYSPEKLGAVYCRMDTLSRKTGERHIYPPLSRSKEDIEGHIFNKLLEGNLIGMPTLLIRRECMEKVGGFRESLKCLEDYEWILRIAEEYRIGLVDEPLLRVYKLAESVSTNAVAYVLTRCYLISKYRREMAEANVLDQAEAELLGHAKQMNMYEEIKELLNRDFEL